MKGISSREYRAIALLAGVGFLSRLTLAFRSTWQIFSRPYVDDAFYLFSCAKHLALGHGFTVDGVHPTNGVQPLICLLYAPGFLLGDDLGLRLTFVVGALVQAASTIAIAILVRRMQKDHSEHSLLHSAPFFAGLLWTVLPPLADLNGSGLETGLVTLLVICSLIYYTTILERGWSTTRAILFGVLLGVTVLARVDSALLVVSFVVVEWRHLKYALLAAFVALLVSSPWWIYGYVTFGSLMPMSGSAESIEINVRHNLAEAMRALLDMLTIFFNHAWYQTSRIAEVALFLFISAFWIWIIRRFHIFQSIKSSYRFRALLPVAFFSIVVFVYYTFFFNAPYFLPRYFYPIRLLILISFSAALPFLLISLKAIGQPLKIVFVVVAILAVAFGAYRGINQFTAAPKSDFYPLGLWALKHEGRVGCDQSGQAEFVAANVVNLDGKVNYEALKARKRGSIGEYIAREHIEYLADWDPLVNDLVHEAAKYGAQYQLYDSIRYVRIYRRVN
jgi:hypothetical protein